MRDNKWLEKVMYDLWEEQFNDVPRQNKVTIKFGKRAKRTLGSIKYIGELKPSDPDYDIYDDKRITQVTITRHYADEKIPAEVVRGTIAHEMVHYTHGFNSPLEQRYQHPHQGGIMKKEMHTRGLGSTYKIAEKWVKENWINYLKSVGVDPRAKRRRRSRRGFLGII